MISGTREGPRLRRGPQRGGNWGAFDAPNVYRYCPVVVTRSVARLSFGSPISGLT